MDANKINQQLNQAHRTFLKYAQSHPKSLTAALLGGSTLVGIVLFKMIDDGHEDYKRDPKQKMTMDEARLIAMLENAKESSWQQNLENAVQAKEQFMLPGRHSREVPKFMDEIDERSVEILKNQHKMIDKARMRKPTSTKFWG